MLPSHHWYGIVPGWLIFTAMVAVAVVLFARRVTFLVRLLLKGKPAVPVGSPAGARRQGPRLRDRPGAAHRGRLLARPDARHHLLGLHHPDPRHHRVLRQGRHGVVRSAASCPTPARSSSSRTSSASSSSPRFPTRRFGGIVTRPRRLTLSAEGLVILGLIFGLMVSDLVADAGRIVLAPAPSDHWQFAGHAIARALAGLPTARSRRSSTRRGGCTPRSC